MGESMLLRLKISAALVMLLFAVSALAVPSCVLVELFTNAQ